MRYKLMCWLPAVFFSIQVVSAQSLQGDTLSLNKTEAEQRFLQNNLLLLAENLNIAQAEAMILQARLWPNPSLDIDEVNLWATPSQLSLGESLPPIAGGFGENRQISAELEQLILTAGKRRKLIAMEEVSRDMAKSYFEDLLRNLKVEFRNSLTELQYLQFYQAILSQQLQETQQLLAAYQRQVASGNVNRSEIIRLKALQLELRNESKENQNEIHELQKNLVVLMDLPSDQYLIVDSAGFAPETSRIRSLELMNLVSLAQQNRPDLQIAHLERTYYDKMYAYEKAQRVPDVALSVGYDRGGNFLYNFIGFGLDIDIPIFNRNQGQIKYAEIGRDKSQYLRQETMKRVDAEVVNAYRNIQSSLTFFDSIEPGYDEELDRMLVSYTRNFRNRNVSLLEFLDFFETYIDNKRNILNSRKELNENFEELQYVIGTEIN